MKFSSSAIILITLCSAEVTLSLNVPRSTMGYNLSKRTLGKGGRGGTQNDLVAGGEGRYRAGQTDKKNKGDKGKKQADALRPRPCISFEPLKPEQMGWYCAGNGKPATAGMRRPDTEEFTSDRIELVLQQLMAGTEFGVGKKYPAKFYNGEDQKTLMFPEEGLGNGMFEYPIFAKLGAGKIGNPVAAGAFRLIYKQDRANNKCRFLAIAEHLNGEGNSKIVKCQPITGSTAAPSSVVGDSSLLKQAGGSVAAADSSAGEAGGNVGAAGSSGGTVGGNVGAAGFS